MKARSLAPCLLVVVSGCAGQALVRADDMSAADHRRAAEQAETRASRETRAYDGNASPAFPDGYDPKENHRHSADESREHARQHTAAAAFLEQFEDAQCAGVSPSSRAACPLLGPLVRLDDVPGGVRATFASPARARAAIAEMRCHYAFARARHFDEQVGCPLYVTGIDVRSGLDPRSAEIVAKDEKTARLIRELSRTQAVFLPPPR
jgi:hypothetical protein